MGALETLHKEHGLILRALQICDAMAGQLHQGATPDGEDIADLVTFFRDFADRTHNRKEEFLLTPWLHRRGFPTAFGPAACLLMEHERTRRILDALEDASRRGAAGAGRLIQNLEQLDAVLAKHIHDEDGVLEEIARAVPPEERTELDRAFEEAVPDQTEQEARFDALLRTLEASYGGEERTTRPPRGCTLR